jgi:hypothetical protein
MSLNTSTFNIYNQNRPKKDQTLAAIQEESPLDVPNDNLASAQGKSCIPCNTHGLPVKKAMLCCKAKLLTGREPLREFAARAPTHDEHHILWIITKSVKE